MHSLLSIVVRLRYVWTIALNFYVYLLNKGIGPSISLFAETYKNLGYHKSHLMRTFHVPILATVFYYSSPDAPKLAKGFLGFMIAANVIFNGTNWICAV